MTKFLFLPIFFLAGGIFLFFSTGCFSNFGSSPSGDRLKKIKKSPNYDLRKGKFRNIETATKVMDGSKMWDSFNRFLFGKEIRSPENAFPVKKLTKRSFNHTSSDSLRIMKIGHSSVLIEIEGKYILTDPVWSNRPSPVNFAGPTRFHSTPLPIGELPELDAVLISHDHYDHLDKPTIMKLAKTGVHFYMPLGVGAHFESWDIPDSQYSEYDWQDSITLAERDLKFILTPARHFSGRGLFDRNSTLWGSWTIIGKNKKVFFSGDSGYMPEFKEIGKKYGPFDLTMIDMGAYDKSWPEIHMTPEEAVQAHKDLKGNTLIPIHWGTYSLNIADWFEPIDRFIAAADKDSIQYYVPYPGEIVSIKKLSENLKWWAEEINAER